MLLMGLQDAIETRMQMGGRILAMMIAAQAIFGVTAKLYCVFEGLVPPLKPREQGSHSCGGVRTVWRRLPPTSPAAVRPSKDRHSTVDL
ncbi:MAG TPA: hypothetical protein VG166_03815 [Caulobacteraceae bacterium]|jgi:hypothetical protein|nr:hypothetical protein [Caulobacteraceae bacterium]